MEEIDVAQNKNNNKNKTKNGRTLRPCCCSTSIFRLKAAEDLFVWEGGAEKRQTNKKLRSFKPPSLQSIYIQAKSSWGGVHACVCVGGGGGGGEGGCRKTTTYNPETLSPLLLQHIDVQA